MRHAALILVIPLFLVGCQTTKQQHELINKNFLAVNFQDGLTEQEAIDIAKKNVLDSTPPESYIIEGAQIMADFESVPYQDQYWFVSFPEVERSSSPVVYMVVIRKDTGKIVFSRSYSPLNEWVLEAALLKLHEKMKRINDEQVKDADPDAPKN